MIVWEGNKKEFGTSHQSPSVPQNAIKIRDAEGFIGMSLAPAVLGIIPLIGVILTPITMKPLLTICIVSAFMGLISPVPDYMDVISVLRKTPKGAVICDSQIGLYAYIK